MEGNSELLEGWLNGNRKDVAKSVSEMKRSDSLIFAAIFLSVFDAVEYSILVKLIVNLES